MACILIVDDDTQVREFLVRCLMKQDSQHTLLTAVNGEHAIKICNEIIPDLVITDWEMPVMDGLSTVKHLKSIGTLASVPIIMCTGVMTDSMSMTNAFEAGVIDFIRKPVDEMELIARVSAMLKFHDLQKEKLRIEKEKLELELHYRQQEISNYVLQLTQKNDFLVKLRNQLKAEADKHSGNGQHNSALQKVISSIDFVLGNDTWTDLNKIVNTVEPGFIERLQKRSDEITSNEIRMCSLIRLKLSTKEMAQLLNISAESITKNRYRLKKKLFPDSDLSLEQLIQSI